MIRALAHFILWSLVCGILYPAFVFGTSKLFFSKEASGSILKEGDRVVGSELLAQQFASPKYFHVRPSASNYDPSAGGASNQGPTSSNLQKSVEERRSYWMARGGEGPVPSELLHASASGLDPHLSPEAIRYQIPLVAKERGYSKEELQALENLVTNSIEGPQWGLFGSPKINVLKLNIKLNTIR
ncbi:potassium-transporting ATPase subunit KdpC [Leptospira langatensis]|uniref:Potassium-transporting ATPase KdpC subunit n=1 Tax=Leptospira langatensis TaxID=2484983 RepID=A0A5F1ZWH7_9LEPT|nr:potassium-transporting ATPase subunit KdpC [Leptospira langatensis]TGJ98311.1 potassium-transporting ATPase subunit KdpC [Leptospira langatensis]TGL43225.1 potassium-transporting ATPase subunit KdpC [Leptospira langatensis]